MADTVVYLLVIVILTFLLLADLFSRAYDYIQSRRRNDYEPLFIPDYDVEPLY